MSHTNESYHVIRRMKELCHHMYDSCHVWISHAIHEWVMSQMNESCHICMRHVAYDWDISNAKEACLNCQLETCEVEDWSLLANTGSVVICSACSSTIEFDLWKRSMSNWVSRPSWGDRRGWSPKRKGKNQTLFLVLSPRPGPDGPNASGWYRRLREQISPLSLLNCDQLWQLCSRGCTILLFNCYLRTRL